MSNNTIQCVLTKARTSLHNTSDSPALDAELILAHVLNKSRTYCHTWPEQKLLPAQLISYEKLIQLRMDDYPVAYILGYKSFWTFELDVTTDILIPRPETELLVEIALEKIKTTRNPKILDLGTGSGAIALAFASERADAHIVATDFSEKALKVAYENSLKLGLIEQIDFIQSNWFETIHAKKFDLIVSNPPYIDPDDKHLQGSIKHEPQSALIANNKGMQDIETIIQGSTPFLNNNSWLIVEHGYDQSQQTQQLFIDNGYSEITKHRDLNNNPRLTMGKLLKG